MTSLDALEHPLVELLKIAFAGLIERGDADVVVIPESNDVEVQGDDWTLHLEGWPLGIAWIALDETPSSHAERVAALDAALGSPELAALRDADRQLDGTLTDALADSGDGLSQALVLVLDEAGTLGDADQDAGDPG